MKLTTATPATSWFGQNIVRLAVLLGIAMIGFILTSTLYPPQRSTVVSVPATTGITAALDQHERHPAGLTTISTPLGQHERHPAGLTTISTPLDQHERHRGSS